MVSLIHQDNVDKKPRDWKLIGTLIPLVIALVFTSMYFPGTMSADSFNTYNEALLHSYSSHHPPAMAFLWHYLNYIHKGPALMLLLNMTLLWGAVYKGYLLFRPNKIAYLFLLIPFVPNIAAYAGCIWKDILFSFGYGFIALFLATYTVKNIIFSFSASVWVLSALTFFTAVKFQAQFILPVIVFWFFAIQYNFKNKFKIAALSIFASSCIIMCILAFNGLIISTKGSDSNSWQCVKIFDLAGMSVYSNQMLFPEVFFKHKDITVEDVKRKYFEGELAWEAQVAYDDSPFNAPKDYAQREILLQAWRAAVKEYPLRYLQHRSFAWFKGLFLQSIGQQTILKDKGFNIADKFVVLKSNKFVDLVLRNCLSFIKLTAFIFILPFYLLIIIYAWRCLKDISVRHYARAVLCFNAMGITLLLVLLFFSLAFVPRYIFFCTYMFLLSIPFALRAFLLRSKLN